MSKESVSEIATGIFILPFFLFSATAGQLADKYDKAKLIQRLKVVELVIAAVAGLGFFFHSVPLMFCALALLGVQSAFFGPLKYGIIPQLLCTEDLTEGNAAVETGTKLSILLGMIAGGLLSETKHAELFCSVAVFVVALAGFFAAKFVPSVSASDPDLKVEWNPITPTFRVIGMARKTRAVFLSILGISWFWALGGTLITLLPVYASDVLRVQSQVATLFSAMFSIGVAIGAVLCGKFSKQRLELGLVPFGSLGITLFLGDLALVGSPFTVPSGTLLTLNQFLHQGQSWRILFDLMGIAVCSGLYIVPLNTMIQQRTEEENRSRIIGANNVMNAGVMSLAAICMSLLGSKLGLPLLGKFALLAGLNLFVGLYIYTLIPEFFLRFLAYILNHILYRLKVVNESNIPREGAAVLVGNHVSFIDWLVVLGGVHRPIRFVMWHTYYELPLVRYLFRDAGAIPIASGKKHPELLQAAFDTIDESLGDGALVCIFPEGQLTADGEVGEFRKGLERILERRRADVVPFALQGLWDSLFSRQPDRSFFSRLKRFFRPRVSLLFGETRMSPPPTSLTGFAEEMKRQVLELRGDNR